MCFGGKGGLSGIFGNGGLGGLIGAGLGGLADFAFPELGIPLSLATGGGGFLGNLFGGGNAKDAALEGLTAGAAGGLGEAISGGGFFGAPGGSGISGLFGGGSAGAGGAGTTAVADAAPTTAAATGGAALPGAVSQIASAAAGPTDITGGIGATTSAAPAITGNAVGTAAGVPSTVTGGISDVGSAFNQAIPGADSGTVGSLGSKILDYLKANPATALTAGAALFPLLRGNTTPGLGSLKSEANLLATQGNQEAQALATGQLPQGAQAALDNAAAAAKAQIRSQYGAMGLTGSTLEADKLASIDSRIAEQKFGMLKDVTDTGLKALGQANPLLEQIMNTEISQDKATSDAIAKLAAALAGAGSGATTKAVA